MSTAPTRQPAPIRVTWLLNDLRLGGAERQVQLLVSQLQRERIQAEVLPLKGDDTLREAFTLGGVEPQPHLGVQRGLQRSALQALTQALRQQGTQVLVCTNFYAYVYGWLATQSLPRAERPARVLVMHTTTPGTRKEAWQLRWGAALVRRSDALVYVSHHQARYWRRQGWRAPREVVITNGIPLDHFTPQPERPPQPGQALRVGLCAVLRPEKAPLDLLHAARRLAGQGRPIEVSFIGDGPLRPALQAQIDAWGWSAQARICGVQTDVRPWMAQCEVMALPSHAVETLSLSALESMALGRPVVLSDVGGARELITPGVHGLLHAPGDVPALAACIDLLHHRDTRLAMGQAASARVRAHFGADTMARAYEDFLWDLAGPGRPWGQHRSPLDQALSTSR